MIRTKCIFHLCVYVCVCTHDRCKRGINLQLAWMRPSPSHSPMSAFRLRPFGWLPRYLVLFAMGTQPCPSRESLHWRARGVGAEACTGCSASLEVPVNPLCPLFYLARSTALHEYRRRHHTWFGGRCGSKARCWKILLLSYILACHGPVLSISPPLFPRCTVRAGICLHVIMCVSVSTDLIYMRSRFAALEFVASSPLIYMRNYRSCFPSHANIIRIVLLGVLNACNPHQSSHIFDNVFFFLRFRQQDDTIPLGRCCHRPLIAL